MGVIATLFQCDQCEEIVKVQTEEEWRKFDDGWADAGDFYFCQNCKIRPEVKILIQKENARINFILNRLILNTEVSKNANV